MLRKINYVQLTNTWFNSCCYHPSQATPWGLGVGNSFKRSCTGGVRGGAILKTYSRKDDEATQWSFMISVDHFTGKLVLNLNEWLDRK